ncbi:hypothetical protein B0T20DRAFT_389054 [Sordaria brevicollis]|uniref:Uncharacterized protein n=1 Tax=Sordaria brevicollis TaxID=83679 RepID=A0AAE0PNR3_SORBR|nr:hypothetical protein B0T20DRAFT_389054 [Sordaria brevicollis]
MVSKRKESSRGKGATNSRHKNSAGPMQKTYSYLRIINNIIEDPADKGVTDKYGEDDREAASHEPENTSILNPTLVLIPVPAPGFALVPAPGPAPAPRPPDPTDLAVPAAFPPRRSVVGGERPANKTVGQGNKESYLRPPTYNALSKADDSIATSWCVYSVTLLDDEGRGRRNERSSRYKGSSNNERSNYNKDRNRDYNRDRNRDRDSRRVGKRLSPIEEPSLDGVSGFKTAGRNGLGRTSIILITPRGRRLEERIDLNLGIEVNTVLYNLLEPDLKNVDEDKEPPESAADNIPLALEGFEDIFSKEKAKALLQLPDAKYKIVFKEGEEVFNIPIYPLSIAQLETLCEYLEENLRISRIRYS